MTLPEYLENLKEVIEVMKADDYHTGKTAIVEINAPLALAQLAHNTKITTIEAILKDLAEISRKYKRYSY